MEKENICFFVKPKKICYWKEKHFCKKNFSISNFQLLIFKKEIKNTFAAWMLIEASG
jgi:hypothetical protein